jgi:hypothetical protein
VCEPSETSVTAFEEFDISRSKSTECNACNIICATPDASLTEEPILPGLDTVYTEKSENTHNDVAEQNVIYKSPDHNITQPPLLQRFTKILLLSGFSLQ